MLLRVLLLLAAAAPARASGAARSLDDFMRFPARTQLMAWRSSATGDRLAWVEMHGGVQNIVVALERHQFAPVPVTAFAADDGFDITLHGWGANASDIYFHRGPADDANPSHLATPPTKQFFKAALPPPSFSGAAWPASVSLVAAMTIVDNRFGRLLFTRSSAQSGAASGNLAATGFASAELWHLDATTGEERMLFSTKHGSLAGFAWSPDGRTLAFDNHRGDHGFVGLYDYFAGGAVQWVAPSYDTDYGVLW